MKQVKLLINVNQNQQSYQEPSSKFTDLMHNQLNINSHSSSQNADYLNFIKNNHNMIEKHLITDFQHPYKNSLFKSHKPKKQQPYKVSDGGVFISMNHKQPYQQRQKTRSLQTIEQIYNSKIPVENNIYKRQQFTNPSSDRVSQRQKIYNSLNYFKNNQSPSIGDAKQHVSKQQIQKIIESKNREISQQLANSKNNVSDIIYKSNHHSQSTTLKYNNLNTLKNQYNGQSVNLQRLKNNSELSSLNHQNFSQMVKDKRKAMEIIQKNQGNLRYADQYLSEPQLESYTAQKNEKQHHQSMLPSIKKRTQSLRNQGPQSDLKLKSNIPHFAQYDIVQQIHSKKLNSNFFVTSKDNSAKNLINTLSSSINQLRRQFQQNSDAIKMYKKVQKNNKALNVRQINQKNLKSYYEYENSIIRNQQLFLISEQQRRNTQILKQYTKSQRINKMLNNKLDTEGMDNQKSNSQITNHIETKYLTDGQRFLRQIQKRNDSELREFLQKTISPVKRTVQKSIRIEQQLIQSSEMIKSSNMNQNATLEEGEQLSNGEISSPSKSRKYQNKQSPQIIMTSNKSESTIYDFKIKSYRQFAFKLYFSHKKFTSMTIKDLPTTTMKYQEKYRFYVGKGNNSLLIKSLMKRRFWWVIQEDPKKAHFVWTQLKINSLYQYQKKSDQSDLYYKVQQKLNDQQDQSNKKVKRTKKKDLYNDALKEKKSPVFRAPLPEDHQMKIFTNYDKKIFSKFTSALNDMNNPQKMDNFTRRLQYFPEAYFGCINENQSQLNIDKTNKVQLQNQSRMHNHFQFNHFIGNKKALFYNLRYYYELIGEDVCDIIPLTFHIKNGVKDPQYTKFLKYYKSLQKKTSNKQKIEQKEEKTKQKKQKNIWIIKPGENSNRGNGIQVFDEIYELNNILKKKDSKHKNGQQLTYIVQKYIEKPLLYKNRKFDIRHYFMVSRLWGKMRVYFFGEGYIRTSSYEFNINDVGDSEIHLTNDAIQKHCDTYGKYEEANKLSYVQFQRYLDSLAKQQNSKSFSKKSNDNNEKKSVSFANQIYPQMKNIAIQAVKACYIQLDPNKTEHNFEIFGMDFMIDKDFKVWLIQINTNPCLELSAKLLQRVIPSMLQQSLRLTIDIIFPPIYHYPNTMKHMMPDYSLQKFKFQLIFDEDRDGKQIQELFQKRLLQQKKQGKKSIREMLLGQIDQEDETYENDGKQINVGQKGSDEIQE